MASNPRIIIPYMKSSVTLPVFIDMIPRLELKGEKAALAKEKVLEEER